MTKPIDPEIKALRALVRALEPLDQSARERTSEWLYCMVHDTTQDRLHSASEPKLRRVG